MTTFQTTHIVYFSPTHTSEKIARAIGEGIGMERRIETDLTLDESTSTIEINGSLTILAAPVYGGRVAPIALQRMKRLKGTNAPVILAVVYGNRDYEDALVELRDTAIELGFTPLSAGAFIGEHSYSTPALPVAMGRPDEAERMERSYRDRRRSGVKREIARKTGKKAGSFRAGSKTAAGKQARTVRADRAAERSAR